MADKDNVFVISVRPKRQNQQPLPWLKSFIKATHSSAIGADLTEGLKGERPSYPTLNAILIPHSDPLVET